jgi:hypothetical protein
MSPEIARKVIGYFQRDEQLKLSDLTEKEKLSSADCGGIFIQRDCLET